MISYKLKIRKGESKRIVDVNKLKSIIVLREKTQGDVANYIGKTQSYDLLKKYKEGGGQYIRIGRLTRVPQDSFETYLLKETEKYQNETGS